MNFQQEVQWSRRHFDLLKLNAVWGVPRSGLIFRKVSHFELALDNLMPWSEAMGQGFRDGYDVPPTREKLRAFQQEDFRCIAQRFNAAGIDVTDSKQLLKD
jgi:hypothetical protein